MATGRVANRRMVWTVNMPQTPYLDDHDGDGSEHGVEAVRRSLGALLQTLLHTTERHLDRVAIGRALEESAGECLEEVGNEVTSDQSLTWLENAAERLGLRLSVQRLNFRDAMAFSRRHLPTAVLSATRPDRGWLAVVDAGWRKVRVEVHGADSRWQSMRQCAAQLELPSDSEDVWVVSPVASRPYDDHDDHQDGHGRHGDHGQSPSPLRRLLVILQPESADIAVVAVFSAVVGLLALASPVAVEALVNTVAFGRFLQPVVVLSLILFTFLAFAATLRIMQAYISEIIQRRIFVRVVSDLAYRLPRVRQSAFDEHHGPELLNRFFDVMTVQKTAALLVLDGIAIVLQTVIGMSVLAFYHPYLLGFDAFLIGCLAVIVFALGRGGVRTAIDESHAKYRVAAWLEDLAGVPLAYKTVTGARRAWDVADGLTSDYVRARRRHFRVLLRQIVFAVGLQAVGGALLLGIGGGLVINGQLTLGQLVAAELIVAVILGSFAKLGKHLESYYDLLAAVNKIGHLFDLPVERTTGAVLENLSGPATLRLRRVGFGFGAAAPVLRDATFNVSAGEFVALVGPPGSGKSLLLDLVLGIREPTSGRLEIDGHDLRSLQPAALRRHVSLARDREIFLGTIAENVHLDRAGVGLTQVRSALNDVGLWEEILDLPAGLDTPMSSGGQPLTDSQVRRLLLARALVGRPRLLLIDELLDALPSAVLPRVIETLRALQTRCTVILVTGRDDIAALCSRVIPIEPDGARPVSPDLVSTL